MQAAGALRAAQVRRPLPRALRCVLQFLIICTSHSESALWRIPGADASPLACANSHRQIARYPHGPF
jgi:hypothetical protein